jgi:taurine--2-oxoglutarate transaminase
MAVSSRYGGLVFLRPNRCRRRAGGDAAPMQEMMTFAMNEGLYLSGFSIIIRLKPSLNVSEENLGFACGVLDSTLETADQ